MRVVIVGPGRMGCGYLAPLFYDAGWEVTLATRTRSGAERICHAGRLIVRMVSTTHSDCRTLEYGRLHAIAVDSLDFAVDVAQADLVCTSVGVGNLQSLAPHLARGLGDRSPESPLDVWVVENDDAAARLERDVRLAAAEAGHSLPTVSFAGAVPSVVVGHGSWRDSERPEFIGDSDRRMYVDTTRLVTPIPALEGVEGTSKYLARLKEKLYVFNAGHAICGYLGWLRGHGTVAEAVADTFLRPMIAGSMLESRRALLRAHPELGGEVDEPVAIALERFANRSLADPIDRVARDPIRKLGHSDRLLGPVELIRDATEEIPPYFALGIAAALLYRNDSDSQAKELQKRLERHGVMAVLEEICGIPQADPLAEAVATRYRGFMFTEDKTIFPPVHTKERHQQLPDTQVATHAVDRAGASGAGRP